MAAPKNYLVDMDGVLIRGRTVIPGAQEFVQRLQWPYQATQVVDGVADIED